MLWDAVAEIKAGRYNYKDRNGNYFVDTGDKLIITDGDFDYPSVPAVFEFRDKYETNRTIIKELVYSEIGHQAGYRETLYACQSVFGKENIVGYFQSAIGQNERTARFGEGKNGRELSEAEYVVDNIRYSIGVGENITKSNRELVKENQKLSEQVELLKQEMRLSGGHTMKRPGCYAEKGEPEQH